MRQMAHQFPKAIPIQRYERFVPAVDKRGLRFTDPLRSWSPSARDDPRASQTLRVSPMHLLVAFNAPKVENKGDAGFPPRPFPLPPLSRPATHQAVGREGGGVPWKECP